MANTYLTRTSGSPTNALKWTYSFWVKLKDVSNDIFLLDFNTDGNNRSNVGFFGSDGEFQVYEKVSGSTSQLVRTSRVFRDPNAWYHIVVSCDRTLSTAADRTKIYVNGSRITSFASETQPTQNATGIINTAVNTLIGKYSDGSLYFSGSLAHVHFIDGTAYAASTFGETNSTSGIWVPKFAPSVSYGNNGFFLKFENSGAMGTDSSGNSNTFAVGGGTLTQNVDTPTNNFSTWNVIMNNAEDGDWANGNLTIGPNGDDTYLYAPTTIGVSSGKWYSEHMITGGNGYGMLGAISEDNIVDGFRQQTGLGTLANSFGFRCRDGAIRMASSNTTYGSAPGTSSAILGMALDMTNKKVWYHINGTYVTYGGGVGNPGAGTYGFDFSSLSGSTFLITCGDDTASGYGNFKSNFGSGYFGTAAVSSANADANGHGIFEYAVPSGFYTLNTKNLKEFG